MRAVRCIQMVKLACRAFAGKRFTGVVDQVFDDAVLLELLGAVLQVFPHQILGERKNPHVRLFQHFPLGNLAHRQPERLQHLRHINTLLVRRHDLQASHFQLETGFEQMQQRRIHDGFIVMPRQPKAATHRLPLQRDRNQQQRCHMHGIGFLGFGPAQQADGQVQRVGAALFQPGAGGAVNGQQVAVQRVFGGPGQQFAVAQRFERHVIERAATGALRMHLGHARISALHQLGQRPDLEFSAVGQRVFQPAQVGRDKLQRGLGGFEIEQPVAQCQVEQARFPGGQPALGRVVCAHVQRCQRVGVQRRQQGHWLNGGRRVFWRWQLAGCQRRSARGQRLDLHFAGAVNVDGVAKAGVLQQVRMALLHRNAQRRAIAGVLGHTGGLKHQQLAAVNPLANRLHVVDQHIGKTGQVQPDADPGMAFFHQNDRSQAGLLQARGKQHRQVQAGGNACFQNAVGRADFLAVGAERSRRFDILQIFCRDGAVDAGHLFPHYITAF